MGTPILSEVQLELQIVRRHMQESIDKIAKSADVHAQMQAHIAKSLALIERFSGLR
jgi:hypothetical protein